MHWRWLRKAAEGGDLEAVLVLANRLSLGLGCEVDSAQADDWFKEGCKLDRLDALVTLKADSVSEELDKAITAFEAWQLRPENRDDVNKIKRENQAAREQGLPTA